MFEPFWLISELLWMFFLCRSEIVILYWKASFILNYQHCTFVQHVTACASFSSFFFSSKSFFTIIINLQFVNCDCLRIITFKSKKELYWYGSQGAWIAQLVKNLPCILYDHSSSPTQGSLGFYRLGRCQCKVIG